MKSIKTIEILIESVLFSSALLFVSSCSQNTEKHTTVNKTSNKITSPKVTLLANLPDNSKPAIIFVEKANKPTPIFSSKQPTVHSFIDSITHEPIRPEAQGIGFFTTLTTDQGLPLDRIYCSTMDKKGNLWFGTENGASRYDGKSFTNYFIEQGLVNNWVYCIAEDKTGNLWFGTIDGLSRYDGKSFTNYTIAHGLTNTGVHCMTIDKTGNLWFGTIGGGVNRYDGKSFVNYTTIQGLANNIVYGITECLNDLQSEKLRMVLSELPEGNHLLLDGSYTDNETIIEGDRLIQQEWGNLDVLVNCAGLSENTDPLGMDIDRWRIIFDSIVNGCLLISKLAIKFMSEGGRVIHITSIHGSWAEKYCSSYSMAKSAINQYCRSMAIELAGRGILLNAIAPGFVNTPMSVKDGENELETRWFKDNYKNGKHLPLRRAAEPEEIAGVAFFLAGKDASYITGQVITVDGGLTITF